MKKLSETYKEQGIDFKFPISIKNPEGRETYYEVKLVASNRSDAAIGLSLAPQ
jgi:hypothetical protein